MAMKSRDPDNTAEQNNISEINKLMNVRPYDTMDIRSHASVNKGEHMVPSSFETGPYKFKRWDLIMSTLANLDGTIFTTLSKMACDLISIRSFVWLLS